MCELEKRDWALRTSRTTHMLEAWPFELHRHHKTMYYSDIWTVEHVMLFVIIQVCQVVADNWRRKVNLIYKGWNIC